MGQSLSDNTKYSQQLDYILFSKDIKIKDAGVYFPKSNRVEMGCGNQSFVKPALMSRVRIDYKKNGQNCSATVSRDFYEVKKASDHLPLWADIEFVD